MLVAMALPLDPRVVRCFVSLLESESEVRDFGDGTDGAPRTEPLHTCTHASAHTRTRGAHLRVVLEPWHGDVETVGVSAAVERRNEVTVDPHRHRQCPVRVSECGGVVSGLLIVVLRVLVSYRTQKHRR